MTTPLMELSPEPALPPVLVLNARSLDLSGSRFIDLCRDNGELRLELTAKGELIVMPPTGSLTGARNARILQRLANWADSDGTGVVFDSSTGFTLPNGARRSPDAAWVARDRWLALTAEEQNDFAPLCPDFVVELRSASDRLDLLQAKMAEYVANGARLGWLIDPMAKQVQVYRSEQPVEWLDAPESLAGDPVLPGFILRTDEIW